MRSGRNPSPPVILSRLNFLIDANIQLFFQTLQQTSALHDHQQCDVISGLNSAIEYMEGFDGIDCFSCFDKADWTYLQS